jgi:hypothetical protein
VAIALVPGTLLSDISAYTPNGLVVGLFEFRGRRNIVLLFPGPGAEVLRLGLTLRSDELGFEEAVVLFASEGARDVYGAPSSALFIADRYGEIFFSARHPEPLLDATEVLGWLEFINAQCPE